MIKSLGQNKIPTAIFISGAGTNLKNLIKFSFLNNSPIFIKIVVSSNLEAKGLIFSKKVMIVINVIKLYKLNRRYKNIQSVRITI